MSEAWIAQMGVDALPGGGRKQPFYTCLCDDLRRHYDSAVTCVAQSSIAPGRHGPVRHVGVSELFAALQEATLGDGTPVHAYLPRRSFWLAMGGYHHDAALWPATCP